MLTRSISAWPVSAPPPGLVHSSFSRRRCQAPSLGQVRTAWASFRGTELRLTLQDVTATRLFADSPVIVKVLGKQTVPAVIKDRAGSAREWGGGGRELRGRRGLGAKGWGWAVSTGRLESRPKPQDQCRVEFLQSSVSICQMEIVPVS